MHKYDTERRDFAVTTPLTEVHPTDIRILNVSSGVLAHYQKLMSKAIWRPAPGRKLGFLVMQDESILGLIFLASPVIRLTVRDAYLFPNAPADFNYGQALREYMDMSVCVSAQPIGWHWNLGKLMALIAPTLGDYVEERYPLDKFRGVTTTSLWGKSMQYNRIYKYLGMTKGFGHEHVSDTEYERMVAYLESRTVFGGVLPSCSFGAGSNPRMRRIAEYRKITCDDSVTLEHGNLRGVYYQPAVPPQQWGAVIMNWYERWGQPRYEKTKNMQPPYQNGLEDAIVKPEVCGGSVQGEQPDTIGKGVVRIHTTAPISEQESRCS
ncbi:MAG: Druantia anti-phage system protein DruA [Candidatus Sulfotelmatobacter sp.]